MIDAGNVGARDDKHTHRCNIYPFRGLWLGT